MTSRFKTVCEVHLDSCKECAKTTLTNLPNRTPSSTANCFPLPTNKLGWVSICCRTHSVRDCPGFIGGTVIFALSLAYMRECMCVCVRVWASVLIHTMQPRTHIHTYTYICDIHTLVHTCMHAYTHTCMHAYMHWKTYHIVLGQRFVIFWRDKWNRSQKIWVMVKSFIAMDKHAEMRHRLVQCSADS